MRLFQLHRDEDASGVSGPGIVAEGVQFTDGVCALRWLTATASTAVYDSADDLVAIHGHEGRTRLVWLDPRPAGAGTEERAVYAAAAAGAWCALDDDEVLRRAANTRNWASIRGVRPPTWLTPYRPATRRTCAEPHK